MHSLLHKDERLFEDPVSCHAERRFSGAKHLYTGLETLWAQRDRIKHIPTAIVWGDSDVAFKDGELKVWTDLMEHHTLKVLRKIGHFPPEEVIQALRD